MIPDIDLLELYESYRIKLDTLSNDMKRGDQDILSKIKNIRNIGILRLSTIIGKLTHNVVCTSFNDTIENTFISSFYLNGRQLNMLPKTNQFVKAFLDFHLLNFMFVFRIQPILLQLFIFKFKAAIKLLTLIIMLIGVTVDLTFVLYSLYFQPHGFTNMLIVITSTIITLVTVNMFLGRILKWILSRYVEVEFTSRLAET